MDCVRSLIWQTKNRGSRKAPRSLVKITPHKGGRTARFEARLTPAEKEAIMKVIQASGLSYSDWLVQVSGTANTACIGQGYRLAEPEGQGINRLAGNAHRSIYQRILGLF